MQMKRTKDGSVLWKDIDKMLGGGTKVRATTIDLDMYRKLPSLGPPPVCDESENEEQELLASVGDGLNKVEFIMEQIKTNKLFRNKLDQRIKTWESAVQANKELDRKMKDRAIATMDEGFVRQAKAKLEAEDALAQGGHWLSKMDSAGEMSKRSKDIRIAATGSFVNIEIMKKNKDLGTERRKSKSPSKKSPRKASPDKFTSFNRDALLGESERRKHVADRMKDYGRFLKYDGVAHLKPELKKIYRKAAAKAKKP